MAKTIKSLLRISMAIRNLGTLNGCTVAKRFIQTAGSCGTRYSKDELVSPQPHLVIQNTQEPIMFKYCNDYSEIFRIVRANEKIMGGADAARALHELFKVDKKTIDKTEKIYEKEDFLLLCDILKRNIRQLNLSDAILAFKSLNYFDVPSTSVIVQSVLQMIRHSVNELTIQQIEFIDFLFRKCEKTPIIDALKVAMTILYERNVAVQIDRNNMNSLVMAFKYLCNNSDNAETLGIVIHAIRNCKQPLDETSARTIMLSILFTRCDPLSISHLVHDAQSVLSKNITSLDRRTIHRIVKNIAMKVRTQGQHYYHEGFIDSCASAVISEDWGFDDAIEILNSLVKIGHTQIFLLDYIAAKCFEDPTILETCAPLKIANLIMGFAHADYKPVFWDSIQEYVMELLEGKEDNIFRQTKLAINLLCLDCYRPKLVENIFTNYATRTPFMSQSKSGLLLLYQAIKTLYPQYTGPWPFAELGEFLPPRHSDEFPLMTTLESALGGRSYVLSNVRSRLGHYIDHVLVMRKGGFPVAINSEADPTADTHPVRQLDELNPPPDGQVILLLLVPARGYSINSHRMKGSRALQIRTLEALTGYTVIPIQSSMWMSLPTNEKMPYLMQAIRLKCEDISMSANP